MDRSASPTLRQPTLRQPTHVRPALLGIAVVLLALLVAAWGRPPAASAAVTDHTIEEIQGTGASSPYAGQTVRTRGVVTAAYPTGGFSGLTIQTAGTGGDMDLSEHHASDGLFVYLGSRAPASDYPSVGDAVDVTGTVSEYSGLTEIAPVAGGLTRLSDPEPAVKAASVTWPSDEAQRESLESMLLAPRGHYTVTDTYSVNRYGELGLARGRHPLRQPTDVARPGAAAATVAARNDGRRLLLDDGASTDFLPPGGGDNQDVALPYLTRRHPVRVGAAVHFTEPVVLDRRYGAWALQPTRQVTAADHGVPASFEDTRPARPDDVGGRLRIASFNVLNYFTETGEDWVADGGTCSYYRDRDGHPVTVNSCNGDGPRGAADRTNLRRQQAKIVSAISRLDADVLSLEEIENSAKYAGPNRRDDALAHLVTALNRAAGHRVWDYVPSPPPSRRPSVADEDVIRTAFIYQRAHVRPVGRSRILLGAPAFADAREPLAQLWRARGVPGARPFLVVVNHFKSKGSGVDDGTGQGLSNPDRVAQADALVGFARDVRRSTRTKAVFLVGDFNSYTREDPIVRLRHAGYTDLGSRFTDESTYLFDGMVGSLDHVLANRAALRQVTGADVWNVNSPESVAFEYSRYHYNATDYYAPGPFRASDHDPLLVGIRAR